MHMIKSNDKLQLEISENKDVIFIIQAPFYHSTPWSMSTDSRGIHGAQIKNFCTKKISVKFCSPF